MGISEVVEAVSSKTAPVVFNSTLILLLNYCELVNYLNNCCMTIRVIYSVLPSSSTFMIQAIKSNEQRQLLF